jgi:hypothetical protein
VERKIVSALIFIQSIVFVVTIGKTYQTGIGGRSRGTTALENGLTGGIFHLHPA